MKKHSFSAYLAAYNDPSLARSSTVLFFRLDTLLAWVYSMRYPMEERGYRPNDERLGSLIGYVRIIRKYGGT